MSETKKAKYINTSDRGSSSDIDKVTSDPRKEESHEDLLESRRDCILDSDWYESEERVPVVYNFKKLMTFAGPGLLMSIAYLDPGNIEGDLDAGVTGKYSLLWTLFWSTALGWYYQVLSARLGVATQRNLAQNCRE